MENKICYECKINKDVSSFYKFKNDKIQSYCKDCRISYIKDKYECYNNYYTYLKENILLLIVNVEKPFLDHIG